MSVAVAPPPGLRGAARGGLANLAGTAFTGVAGLGVTWLVAHSAHGRTASAGAFFAATAAFVLAGTVAKLGTQTSLVYWPARLRASGQSALLAHCLRIGLVPVAVAGTALGAGLWWAAPLLARTTGDPALVTHHLRLLAPFLPAAALSDTLLAATRGYRSMRPTVLLDRVLRPALQLGAVAVASVWLLPAAWAAPYAVTAALAGRALLALHSGPSRRDDRLARDFWAFGAPRALAGVAQLALQRVDVLLVAALAGLPAAAVYTVAGRFVVLGQFVNQAVSQAVQPRLAERLAVDDRAAAASLYGHATAWLILTTWPLYLVTAAYAPVYLALFGPAYAGAGRVVAVLAAAMLVATGCGMVDMVLAMAGRTRWNLGNVVLALAVTLGVDLVAIPRLGAFGAALGLAAAVCVNNLVPLAQIGYALGLHPFGRPTFVAAGLAVACFGVPALVTRIVAGDRPAALATAGALATALGGAAYAVGALRLRRTLALSVLKGGGS